MNDITLIRSKLKDRLELLTIRHTISRGVTIPRPIYKIKNTPYLIAYRADGARHYYIYKDHYSVSNLVYQTKSQRSFLEKLEELEVI